MLAVPTQPGAGGDGAIDDPGGVDEVAGFYRPPDQRLDVPVEGAQARLEQVVVVDAPGVAGDPAARHPVHWFAGIDGPVGDADGQDRDGGSLEVARVAGEAG